MSQAPTKKSSDYRHPTHFLTHFLNPRLTETTTIESSGARTSPRLPASQYDPREAFFFFPAALISVTPNKSFLRCRHHNRSHVSAWLASHRGRDCRTSPNDASRVSSFHLSDAFHATGTRHSTFCPRWKKVSALATTHADLFVNKCREGGSGSKGPHVGRKRESATPCRRRSSGARVTTESPRGVLGTKI